MGRKGCRPQPPTPLGPVLSRKGGDPESEGCPSPATRLVSVKIFTSTLLVQVLGRSRGRAKSGRLDPRHPRISSRLQSQSRLTCSLEEGHYKESPGNGVGVVRVRGPNGFGRTDSCQRARKEGSTGGEKGEKGGEGEEGRREEGGVRREGRGRGRREGRGGKGGERTRNRKRRHSNSPLRRHPESSPTRTVCRALLLFLQGIFC